MPNKNDLIKCIQKLMGRRGLAVLLVIALLATSIKLDWTTLRATADIDAPMQSPAGVEADSQDLTGDEDETELEEGSEEDSDDPAFGASMAEESPDDTEDSAGSEADAAPDAVEAEQPADGAEASAADQNAENAGQTGDGAQAGTQNEAGGQSAGANGSGTQAAGQSASQTSDGTQAAGGQNAGQADQGTNGAGTQGAAGQNAAQAGTQAVGGQGANAQGSQATQNQDPNAAGGQGANPLDPNAQQLQQPQEPGFPAGEITAESDKGMIVKATFDGGILPEGAQMSVEDPAKDWVAELAKKEVDQVLDVAAAEISFMDAEGNDIKPRGRMTLEIRTPEALKGEGAVVVHIDENDRTALVEKSDIEDITASKAVFKTIDENVCTYAIVTSKTKEQIAEEKAAAEKAAKEAADKAAAEQAAKEAADKAAAEQAAKEAADKAAAEQAAKEAADKAAAEQAAKEAADKAAAEQAAKEAADKAEKEKAEKEKKEKEEKEKKEAEEKAAAELAAQQAALAQSMPANELFDVTPAGVHVHASYGEGVFPRDTVMTIKDVPKEQAIEAAEGKIEGVVDAVAVDITFRNEAGEELQPQGDGKVNVSLATDTPMAQTQNTEEAEVVVAHIDDSNNVEVLPESKVEEATGAGAEFVASEFSIYSLYHVIQAEDYSLDRIYFNKTNSADATGASKTDGNNAILKEEDTVSIKGDGSEQVVTFFKGANNLPNGQIEQVNSVTAKYVLEPRYNAAITVKVYRGAKNKASLTPENCVTEATTTEHVTTDDWLPSTKNKDFDGSEAKPVYHPSVFFHKIDLGSAVTIHKNETYAITISVEETWDGTPEQAAGVSSEIHTQTVSFYSASPSVVESESVVEDGKETVYYNKTGYSDGSSAVSNMFVTTKQVTDPDLDDLKSVVWKGVNRFLDAGTGNGDAESTTLTVDKLTKGASGAGDAITSVQNITYVLPDQLPDKNTVKFADADETYVTKDSETAVKVTAVAPGKATLEAYKNFTSLTDKGTKIGEIVFQVYKVTAQNVTYSAGDPDFDAIVHWEGAVAANPEPSAGTNPEPSAGTNPEPSAGTNPEPSAGTNRYSYASGYPQLAEQYAAGNAAVKLKGTLTDGSTSDYLSGDGKDQRTFNLTRSFTISKKVVDWSRQPKFRIVDDKVVEGQVDGMTLANGDFKATAGKVHSPSEANAPAPYDLKYDVTIVKNNDNYDWGGSKTEEKYLNQDWESVPVSDFDVRFRNANTQGELEYIEYTGKKPGFSLYFESTRDKEEKELKATTSDDDPAPASPDLTLAWDEHPERPGEHELVISGNGKYKGVKRVSYKIIAQDVTNKINVTLKGLTNNAAPYTGKAITPEVEVSWKDAYGSGVIDPGEYEVVYTNNTDVGDNNAAVATVTGKENYQFTTTKTFTITPRQMDSLTVQNKDNFQVSDDHRIIKEYNAGAADNRPVAGTDFNLLAEDLTLPAGSYTISEIKGSKDGSAVNVGKYSMKLEGANGKKNIMGYRYVDFYIMGTPEDFDNVAGAMTLSYKEQSIPITKDGSGRYVADTSTNHIYYTGSLINPKLVTANNLPQVTDPEQDGLMLSYSANKAVSGENVPDYAKLTVTGCGTYEGMYREIYFRIEPAPIQASWIKQAKDAPYGKTTPKEVFVVNDAGKPLAEGTDFEVVEDETSPTIKLGDDGKPNGKATIKVRGQGNYSGTEESPEYSYGTDFSKALVTDPSKVDAANYRTGPTVYIKDDANYFVKGSAGEADFVIDYNEAFTGAFGLFDVKSGALIPEGDYSVAYAFADDDKPIDTEAGRRTVDKKIKVTITGTGTGTANKENYLQSYSFTYIVKSTPITIDVSESKLSLWTNPTNAPSRQKIFHFSYMGAGNDSVIGQDAVFTVKGKKADNTEFTIDSIKVTSDYTDSGKLPTGAASYVDGSEHTLRITITDPNYSIQNAQRDDQGFYYVESYKYVIDPINLDKDYKYFVTEHGTAPTLLGTSAYYERMTMVQALPKDQFGNAAGDYEKGKEYKVNVDAVKLALCTVKNDGTINHAAPIKTVDDIKTDCTLPAELTASNVGTYNLTVTGKANGTVSTDGTDVVYETDGTDAVYEIKSPTITKITVSWKSGSGWEKPYNGDVQAPAADELSVKGTITLADSSMKEVKLDFNDSDLQYYRNTGASVTPILPANLTPIPKQNSIDAGAYAVEAVIDSIKAKNTNYTYADGLVVEGSQQNYAITRVDLRLVDVSLDETVSTYDGNAKHPGVASATVSAAGITIDPDNDLESVKYYTKNGSTYEEATIQNAGTYYVGVQLKSASAKFKNYNVSTEIKYVPYTVGRITFTVSSVTPNAETFYYVLENGTSKEQNPNLTIEAKNDGATVKWNIVGGAETAGCTTGNDHGAAAKISCHWDNKLSSTPKLGYQYYVTFDSSGNYEFINNAGGAGASAGTWEAAGSYDILLSLNSPLVQVASDIVTQTNSVKPLVLRSNPDNKEQKLYAYSGDPDDPIAAGSPEITEQNNALKLRYVTTTDGNGDATKFEDIPSGDYTVSFNKDDKTKTMYQYGLGGAAITVSKKDGKPYTDSCELTGYTVYRHLADADIKIAPNPLQLNQAAVTCTSTTALEDTTTNPKVTAAKWYNRKTGGWDDLSQGQHYLRYLDYRDANNNPITTRAVSGNHRMIFGNTTGNTITTMGNYFVGRVEKIFAIEQKVTCARVYVDENGTEGQTLIDRRDGAPSDPDPTLSFDKVLCGTTGYSLKADVYDSSDNNALPAATGLTVEIRARTGSQDSTVGLYALKGDKGNIDDGGKRTYYVTVPAQGAIKETIGGTASYSFEFVPGSINVTKAVWQVSNEKTTTYNGQEQAATITATNFKGGSLAQGQAYEVDFAGTNKNAGTAKFVVSGKEGTSYEGGTVSFGSGVDTITESDVTKGTLTIARKPLGTVKDGEIYKTPVINVEGIADKGFADNYTQTLTVSDREIANSTLTADDYEIKYFTDETRKPEHELTNLTGSLQPGDTVFMRIEAKAGGNYEGKVDTYGEGKTPLKFAIKTINVSNYQGKLALDKAYFTGKVFNITPNEALSGTVDDLSGADHTSILTASGQDILISGDNDKDYSSISGVKAFTEDDGTVTFKARLSTNQSIKAPNAPNTTYTIYLEPNKRGYEGEIPLTFTVEKRSLNSYTDDGTKDFSKYLDNTPSVYKKFDDFNYKVSLKKGTSSVECEMKDYDKVNKITYYEAKEGFDYNKNGVAPDIIIKDDVIDPLTNPTDYNWVYAGDGKYNNTASGNVESAKATYKNPGSDSAAGGVLVVNGNGNYKNSIVILFEIGTDLSGKTLTAEFAEEEKQPKEKGQDFAFDNKPSKIGLHKTYDGLDGSDKTRIIPYVVLKLDQTTLKEEDGDYTLAVADPVNAGKKTITVKGAGAYYGEAGLDKTLEYTIKQKPLKGIRIEGLDTDKSVKVDNVDYPVVVYDGGVQIPKPLSVVGIISDEEEPIPLADTDYEIVEESDGGMDSAHKTLNTNASVIEQGTEKYKRAVSKPPYITVKLANANNTYGKNGNYCKAEGGSDSTTAYFHILPLDLSSPPTGYTVSVALKETTSAKKSSDDGYWKYTGKQLKPDTELAVKNEAREAPITIAASNYTNAYDENYIPGSGTGKVTVTGKATTASDRTEKAYNLKKSMDQKFGIQADFTTLTQGEHYEVVIHDQERPDDAGDIVVESVTLKPQGKDEIVVASDKYDVYDTDPEFETYVKDRTDEQEVQALIDFAGEEYTGWLKSRTFKLFGEDSYKAVLTLKSAEGAVGKAPEIDRLTVGGEKWEYYSAPTYTKGGTATTSFNEPGEYVVSVQPQDEQGNPLKKGDKEIEKATAVYKVLAGKDDFTKLKASVDRVYREGSVPANLTPGTDITVKDGTTVIPGSQYSVTAYKDSDGVALVDDSGNPKMPKTEGSYKVAVTALPESNYTGTLEADFQIVAKDAKLTVSTPLAKVYNGAVQKADLDVAFGGTPVDSKKYTDEYSNSSGAKVDPKNVDTYTVKVTAAVGTAENPQTEEATTTYKITQKPLSDADISMTAGGATYTGSAVAPAVTVKHGSMQLAEGTDKDYTLSYADTSGKALGAAPTNAGTYMVIATGTNNYTGTTSKRFTVAPKTMSDSDITLDAIADQTYTGKALTPAAAVKYAGKTLSPGTDYDTTYANNIAVGTATVTVTGKGNFQGTKATTFKITDGSTPTPTPTPTPITDDLKLTGLASYTRSSTVVDLQWNKTDGATGYRITYNNTTRETTGTSYEVTGLTPGSSTKFTVVPYNATKSGTGMFVTAKTPNDSSSSSSSSSTGSGSSSSTGTTVTVNRSSKDDDDDDDDDDDGGSGSGSSSSGKVTTPKAKNVSTTSNKKGTATITWKNNHTYDGVEIFQSSDGATFQKAARIMTTNKYTRKNLTSGQTYYYKIRAFKYKGRTKKNAKMSKAKKVTVK